VSVIGHQLDALSRQGCPLPWEVIVVDNGSSDGTRAVVEGFRSRLSRLAIIEAHDRHGPAYARNAGARAAGGRNIAFCDADDEVGEGWLAAVEKALRDHRAIAFRTDTRKLNGPGAARESRQVEGLQQYTYPPYLPYSGATIAVRRDLFLHLGVVSQSMLPCENAASFLPLRHSDMPTHLACEA